MRIRVADLYDCSGLYFVVQCGSALLLGTDPATGAIATVMMNDLTLDDGGAP